MPVNINEFTEMRPDLATADRDINTLTMLHFRFTRNKHNVHKICMEKNTGQFHVPLSLAT
jgi:hypothetical protein